MSIHHCTRSIRRVLRSAELSLFLFLACQGALFGVDATGSPRANVPPGVEYLHHRIGEGPWSIHVVKVTRSAGRFQFVSALAQDQVYGLATVSQQAAALRDARPVAAVNGDFFVIRPGPYQGDPLGLHIAQGELISSPTGPSFWIDREGQPHIGQVTAQFRAVGPTGVFIPFNLNEERGDNEAVLYTPAVGPSTRTKDGFELILERIGEGAWLPLRPGISLDARVKAVTEGGNTELTPTTMVFSMGPMLAERLPTKAPGSMLALHLHTAPDLAGCVTAIGGGPILLDEGRSPEWPPPQPRHPRTALGWNDEKFVLVVVDGRQEGFSVGMTYPELASLMKRLGCRYAVNLDGGGSSTLWWDGRVMNSPSDGRERPVANSLVVIATEPNAVTEGSQN
ncbi:MAG TPA: phosphodiester glycosidase family protein [Sedimentisphaerales bacterium]|nr:phosphodiester glycosidase family protein [Sedimentisphaerales bacterium]